MQNDNLSITGELHVTRVDQNGVITLDEIVPNLVVSGGKAQIAALIAGTFSVFPIAMAIGTNGTAPVITNTALGAEIARVAFNSVNATGPVATFGATYPAGVGTGTIVEAGLFSSVTANAGTMTSRTTSLTVVKGNTDILNIVWTLTVT
jgi:hypothetical protein